MPIHNAEVAGLFDHLADLLEIDGANRFRIRAYRNAARTLHDLPRSAADMVETGDDLSELPDIGTDLAGKIAEIVKTGHFGLLDETRARVPDSLSQLTALPGIGPKRAKALFSKLPGPVDASSNSMPIPRAWTSMMCTAKWQKRWA